MPPMTTFLQRHVDIQDANKAELEQKLAQQQADAALRKYAPPEYRMSEAERQKVWTSNLPQRMKVTNGYGCLEIPFPGTDFFVKYCEPQMEGLHCCVVRKV